MFKEVAVPRMAKQFTVLGLSPGTDYDIILTSLCSAEEKRRTESAPVEAYLTTFLEKVKSFRQDGASESCIVVRWDGATLSKNLTYRFQIKAFTEERNELVYDDDAGRDEASEIGDDERDDAKSVEEVVVTEQPQMSDEEQTKNLEEFQRTVEISGDVRTHKFLDLPSGLCSGFPYLVSIQAFMPTSRDAGATSEVVEDLFMTRPTPPSFIRPSKHPLTIYFNTSTSKFITEYMVSWTEYSDDPALEENEESGKECSSTIPAPDYNRKVKSASFKFPRGKVIPDTIYRVQVKSVASFKCPTYGIRTSRSVDLVGSFLLNSECMWTLASSDISHQSIDRQSVYN